MTRTELRTEARTEARTVLDHVEVGTGDLDASAAFYGGVLGLPVQTDGSGGLWAGPVHLLRAHGDDGGYELANHQAGLRHVGFRADGVDAWAEALAAAGAPVTIAPLDALGGVRVVFATAPEGTHVELVSGVLRCTETWDERVAAERVARTAEPVTGTPVFDHVATTTASLERALRTWDGAAGMDRLGRVPHPGDERGYARSYLEAGEAVMEVFSYDVPPLPPPRQLDTGRTGLRCAVLACEDVGALARAVLADGGRPVCYGHGPGVLVQDADGAAWRLLPRWASTGRPR